MKLTKLERLNLINQYTILAKLSPDDAEHYEELKTILEDGYEIFYSSLDMWISEDMPEKEGKFVLDILDLYRFIEDYKSRSPNSLVLENHYSIFRGFDGNNEGQYMGFARFLILTQGKFSEQKKYLRKNDNLNSHSPMIEIYKKLLLKWEKLGRPYHLNDSQIKEILGISE